MRRSCAFLVIGLAVAGCGSSSSSSKDVTLRVSSPSSGTTTRADRITVRGTVDPPDADVQVVGQNAQVGNGVFTVSVPLHKGRNALDVVASSKGSAPTTTTVTVIRKSGSSSGGGARVSHGNPGGSSSGGGPGPLASTRNCGNGVSAGPNTTCPFAQNVYDAYQQSGSGVVQAYSPATGGNITMYCTAGSAHVCTGGNNASVYFGNVSSYDYGNCGGGVSVGPNTSCSFAYNVRDEYNSSGSSVIRVFSPATGRTYTMYCTSGSPHQCTGGNNAAVYFP